MSTNLSQFNSFGKGKRNHIESTGNCVIYTRVSTKEQADKNMSLDVQRKACEQYAQKKGYNIVGYFGGTYESAKTDERKEFNNMLNFVKRSKEKVSRIIVYSVDRFSRSGPNAIYLSDTLKKEGILIYAVTQPTDTATASGSLQQNIQFIFSEYDNQLRREKCMAGTKEKLLNGEWCTGVPTGYSIVRKDGERKIVLNEKGKLLRKAFYMKAEGVSNEDIRRQLAAWGLKLYSQRISVILRNPFYCGLIAHNLLEGELVEGKQEKMIPREVFLKVNGLLASNHQGYKTTGENEQAPLKRFIKCDGCGAYLRAYEAYKNKKYYYKCNTPGCKCNKRADSLHESFRSLLSAYTLNVSEDVRYLIKEQMMATYNQLTESTANDREQYHAQLKELERKAERLEERYINEEIDRAMFDKYRQKYQQEEQEIQGMLAKSGERVSNPEKCIELAIDYAGKLPVLWDSSDYTHKQKLQFLVFPEGVAYNREKDECRTIAVNAVFHYIAQLQTIFTQNNTGNTKHLLSVPCWVAP